MPVFWAITITPAADCAVALMVFAQNTGIAALIQQSVNVQANLNVGKEVDSEE